MSRQLLFQRRFLPYFCTQFLGAFNDNVYRYAFAILVTYFLAKESQGLILNVALIAFILPFFLFGAIAGQLADKYEKAWLIRQIKLAEIIIMLLGCIALYYQSVFAMLAILFALGTQSAFFGPIKYSILPQHVGKEEILTANAYVEAGTFIAILLGQVLGGTLGERHEYLPMLMISIVGFACLGRFTARYIPSAPAASPDLKISFNIFAKTAEICRISYQNKPVFKSILAISWFWFIGSIILTMFPVFAAEVLAGNAQVAILLLTTFTIGIALGSLACSAFSGGRVEVGLVPIGGLGMCFFTWKLGSVSVLASEELMTLAEVLVTPGAGWAIFHLIMIAFFSGLYIVPLYTFVQTHSDESKRSRIIAVNNIFNSLFMVVAGGLGIALTSMGLSVLQVFQVVAILNLVMVLIIISQIPDFFLRLIGWVLIHSVYRVKTQDLHHIPEKGPALLVCNHVSFVDPVIILALGPRPIRFVMHYWFYKLPLVTHMFRSLRSIPIASKKESPEVLQAAMASISESLEQGHLVCIFPEGGITHTGEIDKFQPGIDEILKRNPVPVVPLALRGMWGTWFSRYRGRALKGLPSAFMKPISLVSGPPVPAAHASRTTMHQKVVELRGDER